ncbi:MAG: lyase [Rhodospirillales bacterium]|nr:lyase [Rhodospirillales bacterium]
MPAPAGADTGQTLSIDEWEVPFAAGRPRDPAVAPDGSVWFVGQENHYLGRFDPQTETFSQRKLDDAAGPHNLIVGRDGVVWYAGNRRGYIGRYDPASDSLTKIKMPAARVRDPHTLVFDHNQQHIWFTAQWSNVVARLTVASLAIDLIDIPTDDARPYGIIVAPDGRPWIALLGTNKLASVNPALLTITEYALPDPDSGPRRLVATTSGQIYYGDFARGRLGHLDPASGQVTEFAAPAGDGSGPYAMAVDGTDRVWFVETGPRPNRLLGFDPESGSYFSQTDIPSGAGSVRHMTFDASTNAIWFGTDAGTLGRARLTAPASAR